ncbi:hypothetical protein P171DRAFT_138081 [Karstenula rhodostoma CBS 690.94]|uniref:Uncharacterized protein n=1 Tax=Karstenula rhodostoma CBS 690.94 TaxID=1392251 RepID=A0A9P4PU87_9PLEO|nr:hypothetical protein P171DRAFT_138081 [Karstenula rhodostoma CBS 690.94]
MEMRRGEGKLRGRMKSRGTPAWRANARARCPGVSRFRTTKAIDFGATSSRYRVDLDAHVVSHTNCCLLSLPHACSALAVFLLHATWVVRVAAAIPGSRPFCTHRWKSQNSHGGIGRHALFSSPSMHSRRPGLQVISLVNACFMAARLHCRCYTVHMSFPRAATANAGHGTLH